MHLPWPEPRSFQSLGITSYTSIVIESMGVEVPGAAAEDAPSSEVRGVLAAVCEPVRWSLLRVLGRGEACVCSLQEFVPLTANLLSYHLKVLREAGFVTSTRRGRLVFYRLTPDAADRARAALPFGVDTQ